MLIFLQIITIYVKINNELLCVREKEHCMARFNFPKTIFSGYHGKCHCQGIAIDKEKKFIYFSFTTKLVKCDLDGNLVGTVDGLIGHLGCIDFCEKDGKVYGSLEFKNDSIGLGILKKLGIEGKVEDGFYIAIFDVDKITKPNMNAEVDGIMKAVYLKEVVSDYKANVNINGNTYAHKYACSGIDGTGWGYMNGKYSLNVCYGVYGDISRTDNDYQVILSYDASDWWEKYAQPLNQSCMHKSGPCECDKYFLYTGNTEWGVQNLEYDAYTGDWLVSVYKGKKPQFPNYTMYIIDGKIKALDSVHNVTKENIKQLSLKRSIEEHNGISGNNFPYGSTGVYAFGNGYYYFSQHGYDEEKGNYTNVKLYRASNSEMPFELDL